MTVWSLRAGVASGHQERFTASIPGVNGAGLGTMNSVMWVERHRDHINPFKNTGHTPQNAWSSESRTVRSHGERAPRKQGCHLWMHFFLMNYPLSWLPVGQLPGSERDRRVSKALPLIISYFNHVMFVRRKYAKTHWTESCKNSLQVLELQPFPPFPKTLSQTQRDH